MNDAYSNNNASLSLESIQADKASIIALFNSSFFKFIATER